MLRTVRWEWTHYVHLATLRMNAHHVDKAISRTPIPHFSNASHVPRAACCAPARSHAASVTAKDSTWSKATAGLASLDVPNVPRRTRVKNAKTNISP